nr:MFS transporter [Magnetospirillum fulvum]
MNLPVISIATALLATAVGASYAYVDLSMNRMGASATAIGLNAAMPPLGWLLGTPLMPWALRRFNPKLLLPTLLAVAAIALTGFPLLYDQEAWLGLRFLFGGCCGLAFRLIEYWVNAASPSACRARNLGIYNAAFCTGAASGALVVPTIGLEGWPPILLILAFTTASAVLLGAIRDAPPAPAATDAPSGAVRLPLSAFMVVPVFGALVFGLFEAVPYTLMPVYVLRLGLSETQAVGTASAFLLGALLFSIPLGILADRIGKRVVLVVSCGIALLIPTVLPLTVSSPAVLFAIMMLWGGVVSSIYSLSLAQLADRFHGSALVAANAVFGTLYALGSLTGSPLHGFAMDSLNPQGLMVSSVILFLIYAVFLFRSGRISRSAG